MTVRRDMLNSHAMCLGGMIFAQVVTLFVTPGIYLYMENIQNRFFRERTDLE